MTYQEYILECQRRQREYIVSEQERMVKAAALLRTYEREMLALGLHPLNRGEIADRTRELLVMAGTVAETHGDSEAMRHAYEMRFDKEQGE